MISSDISNLRNTLSKVGWNETIILKCFGVENITEYGNDLLTITKYSKHGNTNSPDAIYIVIRYRRKKFGIWEKVGAAYRLELEDLMQVLRCRFRV